MSNVIAHHNGLLINIEVWKDLVDIKSIK